MFVSVSVCLFDLFCSLVYLLSIVHGAARSPRGKNASSWTRVHVKQGQICLKLGVMQEWISGKVGNVGMQKVSKAKKLEEMVVVGQVHARGRRETCRSTNGRHTHHITPLLESLEGVLPDSCARDSRVTPDPPKR